MLPRTETSSVTSFVSYSQITAHEQERLVEQSVAVITAFPGVTRALHKDREIILVWGPVVDRAALGTSLREWWSEKLGAAPAE